MESEFPVMIVAQVAQDVFNSPSGRYLLIPKGTRLVGEYSNAIAYGQSRIFVAWQRMVFPNGNTMDIGAMEGGDSQGEAGFHDTVDNHFLRIFGSALLMSAISGATALSQPQQTFSNAPNLQSTLSAALGQQLGAATTSLLEKNLSIPPTLKIRQGFRFNVVVTKDLVFDRSYVVPNY
jgi:type IV secretion system protein VirB10